jgi:histidine triad (HIT) family protein
MSRDPNCIFCKILSGEIPSMRVLENEFAVAFLDINPINHGHVLLVPRTHHSSIDTLPEDVAAGTAKLLPGLSRAIHLATGSHGLNIIINNGRAAGQTIFHGHWHLVPRFVDDSVNWPWPHTPYSGDELAQMQFRIQRELGLQGNH